MIKFDSEKKAAHYSPLALAYIGDSVYEVYVRSRVIAEHPELPAHKLHVETIKYVKAHAQSNSMLALEEELSEEEKAVYKRGRNAKSPTVPKNAILADYRRATGFEALVGYLFIDGKHERAEQIMKTAFESAADK
jgi:ribonuclease-3 family protein